MASAAALSSCYCVVLQDVLAWAASLVEPGVALLVIEPFCWLGHTLTETEKKVKSVEPCTFSFAQTLAHITFARGHELGQRLD